METNHFFPFKRFPTYFKNFKKDVRPDGIRSVHFLKSEWESYQPETRVSTGYLVYRVFIFVAFAAIIIFQATCWSIQPDQRDYYLIYLTHWTIILTNLYSVLFMALVIRSKCVFRVAPTGLEGGPNRLDEADNQRELGSIQNISSRQPRHFLKRHSLPPLEKGIWICLEMSFTLAYTVTIGYWGFLNGGKNKEYECANHSRYMTHGFNAILMTLDMFVVAVPIRLFHMLYTFLIGLVYIAFSGIYEVAGGKYPQNENGTQPYIYGFLNWKEKAKYASIVPFIGCVVFICLHLYCMFLFSLRLFLVSKLNPKLNVYQEQWYDYAEQENILTPENNLVDQGDEANNTDTAIVEADSVRSLA